MTYNEFCHIKTRINQYQRKTGNFWKGTKMIELLCYKYVKGYYDVLKLTEKEEGK